MGGIFPNRAAVTCLAVVLFLKHNDEWVAQRVHTMTLETIAPLSDDLTVNLSALVADPNSLRYPGTSLLCHAVRRDRSRPHRVQKCQGHGLIYLGEGMSWGCPICNDSRRNRLCRWPIP